LLNNKCNVEEAEPRDIWGRGRGSSPKYIVTGGRPLKRYNIFLGESMSPPS